MNKGLSALLALLFISFSLAADTKKCTDCKCVESDSGTKFARGDDIALCVHFFKDPSDVSKRLTFPLVVDEFQAVGLYGVKDHYKDKNQDTHIAIQAHGNLLSHTHTFMKSDGSTPTFYSSLYNVVIRLEEGQVQNIIWDDYCAKCSKCESFSFADEGTNYDNDNYDQVCNMAEDCFKSSAGDSCQAKILVSFMGTDKNGARMESANMRPSRMAVYGDPGAYLSAQNTEVGNRVTKAAS